MFQFLRKRAQVHQDDAGSIASYERHLDGMLRQNPGNRDLAFARAIGSESVETFQVQGDGHVAVLRHNGLRDGMAIFDFGCGCGRTAQALRRSGWTGQYTGVDVIPRFIEELKRKCPGFDASVHFESSIPMPDASLDMLFHWSVFTHLTPEECYVLLGDTFRALKPGGKLVFSFLELSDPEHREIFQSRVARLRKGKKLGLPDTFLHRDWIRLWASEAGFEEPRFTDGADASNHPAFWQSVVTMTKAA